MLKDTEFTAKRRFYIEEAILILLLILSLVGVRITDYSPVDGYGYWIIMVFVFALFAMTIAWQQSRHRITDFKKIIREQSLHWFTSLLVVEGVFSLQKTEHLSQADAGIVIMMILAQSTILDGLRVGWRFSLVGIFLGGSAIIAANTHHFFWIELIIAILIVAVTILIEVWQERRAQA
jgi:cobalamin synthase